MTARLARKAIWSRPFRQANPALGYTITEEAIASALSTDPETIFRTEVLCQHVPDRTGDDRHLPTPGTYGRVLVDVTPGSRLAGVLGERIEVACHHHQAVDRLGDGLVVVASAEDGTVEAVELPGETFCVGVQWHPEEDGVDRRLFEALVGEAGR